MADDEAVVVRNVERVSKYHGYLDTFQWEGFWEERAGAGAGSSAELDILVMDAVVVAGPGHQFQPEVMARDLNKAWVCFKACGQGVFHRSDQKAVHAETKRGHGSQQ